MGREQGEKVVKNNKAKDNGAKLVFDDPVLCAQFLRGYVDIDLLKNVQPEDIEDISERFLPMWQEGRDSDSVKLIHLKELPLFLITIIEHQSKIYYDMSFKIMRYIVMVLTDYETEQEKLNPGITKTKDFKYPPILPIVYYEGSQKWNAVRNFKDRTYLSDALGKYIPDFEYLVVPLSDYSNAELIEKKDELSLIMLVNKLRSSAEFKSLKEIPPEYFENLEKNTPEYLLKLIGKIIAVFLYRLNVPRKEVENFTDQIERREFAMLFDSFEAYDVQETRRISKAEGIAIGREEGKTEGITIGKAEDILELLSDLGTIPEVLQKRIQEETDLDTLKKWLKIAAKAECMEDFRKKAEI